MGQLIVTARDMVCIEVKGTQVSGFGQVGLFPGLAVVQAHRCVGVEPPVGKRGAIDMKRGAVDKDVDQRLGDAQRFDRGCAVFAWCWLVVNIAVVDLSNETAGARREPR